MKCPLCDSDNVKVTNSRMKDNKYYRRRQCLNCDERFTTYEVDLAMLSEIFEKQFPRDVNMKITSILEREFPYRNYK